MISSVSVQHAASIFRALSSETLVTTYQCGRCCITEDRNLHVDCSEHVRLHMRSGLFPGEFSYSLKVTLASIFMSGSLVDILSNNVHVAKNNTTVSFNYI
jgi:hypothetical protein